MTFGAKTLILACILLLTAGMVLAADPQPTTQQPQMPPMGPPEEMKQLASLEGTWDVAAKFNISMDPTQENWMDTKAVAVYTYLLDGTVMQCVYSGTEMMPGMPPLKGLMLQTYDRETKQWQATWIDNMSGRTSIYTGTHGDGKTVMQGEDKMMGQTYLSRITSYNETPTKYDWKMEYSMDGGKTWATSATAVYTKK